MMSFRPKRHQRQLSRLAFAAAVGAAVTVGFAGSYAHAADDDDDDVLLDTKILRYVLKGFGLRKDGTAIDYRERSPLVLPPNKDMNQLPAPEDPAKARQTANWPVDPDVKRARQAREAERKRKPTNPGVDDKPLMQSQMTEGKPPPATTGSKAGEAPGKSMEGSAAPSTNKELGSKNLTDIFKTGMWAPKEEYIPFTGEPPRVSLTEPPKGYRTPSPAQPYGVGKEKWAPGKVDKNEPVR